MYIPGVAIEAPVVVDCPGIDPNSFQKPKTISPSTLSNSVAASGPAQPPVNPIIFPLEGWMAPPISTDPVAPATTAPAIE